MNLRDMEREVQNAIEAGNAVLLVSGSGMGKSQKILQIFNKTKARDAAKGIKWGLGTIFAATQTPTDLIGVPFKGERTFPGEYFPDGKPRTFTVTDPTIPLWMISTEGLPATAYDRFFLIIEEYGQGEPDTKRGIAEIYLNGGTPPFYMPEGSVRVACSNEGARYGVTKDFDFCITRRTRINITPDARVWLEDFADKPYKYQGKTWEVMPITKSWVAKNPEALFEKEPEQQGPWCNPRTLCAFDRYLQIKAGNPFGEGLDLNDSTTMEVGQGTIGNPATMSFMGHLKFRLELPPYEKIVADPMNTELPKNADLVLLACYEMAGMAQPEHMAALLQYTNRFAAKDMQMTFVVTLLRRNYRDFINLPAMQAWIAKNAALVSAINALAN
jgi:hypothetical protein